MAQQSSMCQTEVTAAGREVRSGGRCGAHSCPVHCRGAGGAPICDRAAPPGLNHDGRCLVMRQLGLQPCGAGAGWSGSRISWPTCWSGRGGRLGQLYLCVQFRHVGRGRPAPGLPPRCCHSRVAAPVAPARGWAAQEDLEHSLPEQAGHAAAGSSGMARHLLTPSSHERLPIAQRFSPPCLPPAPRSLPAVQGQGRLAFRRLAGGSTAAAWGRRAPVAISADASRRLAQRGVCGNLVAGLLGRSTLCCLLRPALRAADDCRQVEALKRLCLCLWTLAGPDPGRLWPAGD